VSPLHRLRERLERETSLLIAFSGGVDSALLATVAHDVLGDRAVAVTAVSASLPQRERDAAVAFTRRHHIPHVEVHTDELGRPEYVANRGDRCFHCKSALFDAIAPLQALTGGPVALGTNLDDLGDHRPGQAAATLRGAVFPLLDARLGKAEIRALSRELGLATADKPAAACLSSRIAYGDPVTPEVLRRVELAEDALHRRGFAECRVRAHADGRLARVELPAADLDRAVAVRDELAAELRAAGFTFVTVDLTPLRSGSMNVLLPLLPTRHRAAS
jgi:pyridinium-3,5-biscarboxylic acid mononucleotide sulfurtransferase